MSNSGCSEPFITEEILILSKTLAKERVQYYKEDETKEKSLEEFKPEFDTLDN